MITINNYSKTFRNGKGLKGINLELEKGTIYGLIGPNGAGKTTLITALEGFYKSDGTIDIFGNSISDNFMLNVSSMLEANELVSINVESIGKVYDSFCKDFDLKRFNTLLEKFGLENMTNSPLTLSKGDNLALRIAIALSRKTDVYLLDEPLSGIDIIRREVILNSIFEVMDEDKIIIISSHELHDIDKRIDELIFLNNGEVILKQPLDEMKDMYDMSLVDLYKELLKN